MSEHPEPPQTTKELFRLATAPIREFMNEPMPEGVGFFHVTGSLCLFMALIQVVTGVLLAFYYSPTPETAWESVRYVDQIVPFGGAIHALHHWGASGFVVAVFLHMIRVFAYAAYKGKRKWTWVLGVGLLFTTLGFGFTGYLLPWDMKAYFGTVVGTNIVGAVPFAGAPLRAFLLGGPDVGALTLPRFYAIHVLILPAALAALVSGHLFLVRLFGITPPFRRDDEPVSKPFRFFPDQALRESFVMLGAAVVLISLAWFVGGNLEAKADPLNTAYAPHPEWYFLGLQQLLRYFPGKYEVVGVFILPTAFTLGLVLLPFLDRNPERALRRRPLALTALGLAVAAAVALTTQGYLELRHERKIMAESASAEAPAEPAAGAAPVAPVAPDAASAAAPSPAPAVAPGGEAAVDVGLAKAGADLFVALDCAKCHVGPEVGKGPNIPPALDLAGDRFTPEWMASYMKEVPPRRYETKGRHPVARMPDFKLTERENAAITAHLMTLRRPDIFDPLKVDPTSAAFGSTPELVEKGKALYAADSCKVCHELNGAGGKTAPSLTGVGKRLKPEFIRAIIKNPQGIVPETTMEESFLADEEIAAMTHFLATQ